MKYDDTLDPPPVTSAEYDRMRNAVFNKVIDVLHEENPRTPETYEAVTAALLDVMLTLVMNLGTNPRKLAASLAARLTSAVDAKLASPPGTRH
jgi:hypothetical protein